MHVQLRHLNESITTTQIELAATVKSYSVGPSPLTEKPP